MVAFAVVDGVVTGEAVYQNTGRPSFFDPYSFESAYKVYQRSHYEPAVTILMLFCFPLIASGSTSVTLACMGAFALLWICLPIIFCPQTTERERFCPAWSPFLQFVFGLNFTINRESPKENKSFYWFGLQQELIEAHPDMVESSFIGGIFMIGRAFIIYVCADDEMMIGYGLPYVIAYAVHVVITLVWASCNRPAWLTWIWVISPIVTFVIVPAMFSKQLTDLMPIPHVPNFVGHALSFYIFFMLITAMYTFLLTIITCCTWKDNKKLLRWVDMLYPASLSFHHRFYAAVLVVVLQITTNLLLIATSCCGLWRKRSAEDIPLDKRTDSEQDQDLFPNLGGWVGASGGGQLSSHQQGNIQQR